MRFTLLTALLFSNLSFASALDLRGEAIMASEGGKAFAAKWKAANDYFETGEKGSFKSAPVEIVYRSFVNPQFGRSVMIVPGYGEDAHKYIELIYDFKNKGYNVFIYSHRGMGESGRLAPNRQVIHIDDPKKYYSDADTFFRKVVAPRSRGTDLFMFTHSTGGLIGAHLLALHPNAFKSAVLSSPLFEVNTHGYPKLLGKALAYFKASTAYAPGYSNWDPNTASFATQSGTGSEIRWYFVNELYRHYKGLVFGGPSMKWVLSMFSETRPVVLKHLAHQITTPILIFQAGDDTYTSPRGQSIFLNACASAQMHIYSTARHEIYLERNFIRTDALNRMWNFFN